MSVGDASLREIIRRLESKGVQLWVEDQSLHYYGPPGAITQDDKAAIRQAKDAVIEIINSVDGQNYERQTEARQDCSRFRAPLSFTQEAHWKLFRLHERPSIRQIASAVRLRGRLDVELLEKSLRDVVRRHEALRTRIVVHHGVPEQEISPTVETAVQTADYSNLRASVRKAAIVERIAEHVLEPVRLASDPLLGSMLIKEDELDHTLVLSMEHMISDAVSMNILLRDLFAAYSRTSTGARFMNEEVPIQFPTFARWLRATQGGREKTHLAYWNSHLVERQCLPFPRDQNLSLDSVPAWDVSPIRIPGNLRLNLQKRAQQQQTTLVLCILGAYIAAVSRWCRSSTTVVQYMTHGRPSMELKDTIGYFATPLFICLETPATIRLSELRQILTAAYCEAAEKADYSYLETLIPRPDFCRACIFNWIPQGPSYARDAWVHSSAGIVCEPVDFGQPMLNRFGRDNDPGMTLFDKGEEIVGGMYFPVCRFSRSTIDRFNAGFLSLLEEISKGGDPRIADISA